MRQWSPDKEASRIRSTARRTSTARDINRVACRTILNDTRRALKLAQLDASFYHRCKAYHSWAKAMRQCKQFKRQLKIQAEWLCFSLYGVNHP